MIYSTIEIDTGKKWIDGKPIYRRVFQKTGSLSENTSFIIVRFSDIGLSVDAVVSATGFINYDDGVYAPQRRVIPRIISPTVETGFNVYLSAASSGISVSTDATSGYASRYTNPVVIMEYTKGS